MENLIVNEKEFKIKKMNAVELLALRSQIDFEDYNTTKNLYNILLENMEVKINEKWLPVKEGNNFYPKSIEDDVEAIDKLIQYFMNYLKELFIKSSGSNTEQE